MFNPEFRYLLVQEENDNEMMPIIDKHIISAICVCSMNALFGCGALVAVYQLFKYSSFITKYLWTALWNSLTPGKQWLDLAIIVSSIISGVVMVLAMKGMADVLDNGFRKLKNEINKKEERIRELEAKLEELELEKKKEINVQQEIKVQQDELPDLYCVWKGKILD
jgi:uncharacterized membrane protein (DUF106 family)